MCVYACVDICLEEGKVDINQFSHQQTIFRTEHNLIQTANTVVSITHIAHKTNYTLANMESSLAYTTQRVQVDVCI